MESLGDFKLGDVVWDIFNTHKSDGTPIALTNLGTGVGPALRVVRDNAGSPAFYTGTGITLTVSWGSVVGKNYWKVNTNPGDDAGFFAVGRDYKVEILEGAVNATDVHGTVVGRFSIENRRAVLAPDQPDWAPVKTTDLMVADDVGAAVWLDANAAHFATDLTPGKVLMGQRLAYGTAQNGGANTIVLAAGSSSVNNFYRGATIVLFTGTGAGQSRVITGYEGATLIATVKGKWSTNPDNTTRYIIYEGSGDIPDAYELPNGTPAFDVIGQPDFTSDVALCTQVGLKAGVNGLALDLINKYLFIADTNNNRVLVMDADDNDVNKTALFVLGQPDFVTSTANTAGFSDATHGAKCLSGPMGLFADGTRSRLWVADTGNHRVLRYSYGSGFSNQMAADLVLGQSDFVSHSANRGGTTNVGTMSNPESVTGDAANSRLFVADTSNNRVISWSPVPTSNGTSGNSFLGQSGGTGNGTGVTSTGLNGPCGLAYLDSLSTLVVCDGLTDRALTYTTFTTGHAADHVIGHALFTTSGGAVGQARLWGPGQNLGWDPLRSLLFIPESTNNRVSIYDFSNGISDGMPASFVLGQDDFVTVTSTVNDKYGDAVTATAYDYNNRRLMAGQANSAGGRVLVWKQFYENAFSDIGGGTIAVPANFASMKITSDGYVSPNWGDLKNANATVGLSGTTILAATTAGSVTGAVGSVTGSVGGNVTGSVGSVVGNVGGNVLGAVGSVVGGIGGNVAGNVSGNVVGSVGSVVGNLGGNVVGSVGSVVGNVGGSVATVTGRVLLNVDATALSKFFITNSGETYADSVLGSVVREIALHSGSGAGGSGASTTSIWQDPISGPDFTGGPPDSVGKTLVHMSQIADADQYVDTTTTPWNLVYVKKGTGLPSTMGGSGVELYRKQLQSTTGANITSTSVVPARVFQ